MCENGKKKWYKHKRKSKKRNEMPHGPRESKNPGKISNLRKLRHEKIG